MIIIKITRVTNKTFNTKERVCVREIPTEIVRKTGYNDRAEEVTYDRTYELADKEMSSTVTQTLLEQEIENETEFNLTEVISAINNMGSAMHLTRGGNLS